MSAESTPLLSWSYTPSLFNFQYNRKTAGHRVYYNLQVLWASIQILEAVLYKQQGRSDKPRPCNYEVFIVFFLQMLIVNYTFFISMYREYRHVSFPNLTGT